MQKTVIVLAGPTAVGKTSCAIDIAQHYGTQIISADSRQCFIELNIGVAKPSPAQLSLVKHYFINSHTVHTPVSAATFEEYALHACGQILASHDVAVMTGGTGLYIRAFCDGLDAIPQVPDELRTRIMKRYEEEGIEYLQKELSLNDPVYWRIAEQHNPQRLMRALEVLQATGQSIASYQSKTKAVRPFRIIKTALHLPRPQLYENINQRVEQMMKEGLAEEVKELIPLAHLNALQTVGYKELFQHYNGNISLAEAAEQIKQNTRRYAKRQLTWFGRDEEIQWFLPTEEKRLLSYLDNALKDG